MTTRSMGKQPDFSTTPQSEDEIHLSQIFEH